MEEYEFFRVIIFRKNNKYGIKLNDTIILKPKYDMILENSNFRINKNNPYIIIINFDKNDKRYKYGLFSLNTLKEIIPPIYDSLEQKGNIFVIRLNNKYCLLDINFNPISNVFIYDDVHHFIQDIYVAEFDSKFTIINSKGKALMFPKGEKNIIDIKNGLKKILKKNYEK